MSATTVLMAFPGPARFANSPSSPDKAEQGADMNFPGWRLHPLKGDLADHWSVWVNYNWRITFTFEGGNAVLVDYQDYHGD